MSDDITTVLLREVPDRERARLEGQMREMSVATEQRAFVLLPDEILSICHRNDQCSAFVAQCGQRVVGMRALHPHTSPMEVRPNDGQRRGGAALNESWRCSTHVDGAATLIAFGGASASSGEV